MRLVRGFNARIFDGRGETDPGPSLRLRGAVIAREGLRIRMVVPSLYFGAESKTVPSPIGVGSFRSDNVVRLKEGLRSLTTRPRILPSYLAG